MGTGAAEAVVFEWFVTAILAEEYGVVQVGKELFLGLAAMGLG